MRLPDLHQKKLPYPRAKEAVSTGQTIHVPSDIRARNREEMVEEALAHLKGDKMNFKEALLEEYGLKVEHLNQHAEAIYLGWTGNVRLNVTQSLSKGNRMELFKIMDDEEITFLYEDGDIVLDSYGYDVLEGALLKLWGEI